ncbi:MAG: molybdenum cofactor guanylyltransferase [Planctomycetota bacterium]
MKSQSDPLLGSIVLTGGQSRRMGQAKESLPFRGTTLLGWTVETLLRCTHPVIIVARDEAQDLPPVPLEADMAYDADPGGGPLVGLSAGLRALQGHCDLAFVTGCDTPFLSETPIGALVGRIGDAQVVVPRIGGTLQPLAAIYRIDVLDQVDALVAKGERSLVALVEQLRAKELDEKAMDEFDPGRQLLRNVNSREEYEAAVADAEKS